MSPSTYTIHRFAYICRGKKIDFPAMSSLAYEKLFCDVKCMKYHVIAIENMFCGIYLCYNAHSSQHRISVELVQRLVLGNSIWLVARAGLEACRQAHCQLVYINDFSFHKLCKGFPFFPISLRRRFHLIHFQ